MNRKSFFVLLLTLAATTAGAAPKFPGTLLLGKKLETVYKGGTALTVSLRDVTTSAVRVGAQCDRGGTVRQVATKGADGKWVAWVGRGTGRYATADDGDATFNEIRLVASPVGAFVRESRCTFFIYNANDKSYENDHYPTGEARFVNLNNQNQLQIRDCLNYQLTRAFADQGITGSTVKVWLPPSSANRPDTLAFSVTLSEPFGGKDQTFGLYLLSTTNRWAYSSSSVTIGGVTMSQWAYQTQAMNRLGYVVASDGSGQPLFRMEAGRCWGAF